uniref:Uncharacterized protein n=1 Tax=Magnetococcus massalia (strain MO-1) TaxID=451514 RepID=A0A1S7LNX5_MAGMO|nr:Protein of unknown function [Candidatus Magnetococcus massalia]
MLEQNSDGRGFLAYKKPSSRYVIESVSGHHHPEYLWRSWFVNVFRTVLDVTMFCEA